MALWTYGEKGRYYHCNFEFMIWTWVPGNGQLTETGSYVPPSNYKYIQMCWFLVNIWGWMGEWMDFVRKEKEGYGC